jgi:hypothetical protein
MQAGTMRIGNGGVNDGYVTPDYYLYVQFLTHGLRRQPTRDGGTEDGKASAALEVWAEVGDGVKG